MSDARVALVVEDNDDIRSLLASVLAQAGFTVETAASGAEAVTLARVARPDLITLDLTLPDRDGIEACREIRTFSDAYIVIVTAKGEEIDRLIGLEVGADDYLVKPFSPRELRARVAAMFRRPRSAVAEPVMASDRSVLRHGDLSVDLEAHEAAVAGVALDLTPTEFGLLATLISAPSRVWERQTLLSRVWQIDWLGDTHLVDVHMANLRRKLGYDPENRRFIRTVRGVGYRLGTG